MYNLLVADIMKTSLFYVSFHAKYADLKALLEKSDLRSYPLVDSEGILILCQLNSVMHFKHLILVSTKAH